MQTLHLKVKRAALSKEAGDVREAVKGVQALVVKADCFKAVTGAIPESILSAVDSALSILVPLTSVIGDAELASLLASLKVWIQRKKADALVEEAQRQSYQQSGWSDWWTA